ncbi:hypothetical protein F5884DRAFT_849205 [Xylogone sp. PMI_703]|nr:hypothetical protein F5884DRAFT_849205 [Xylogone sp. PMI_703]
MASSHQSDVARLEQLLKEALAQAEIERLRAQDASDRYEPCPTFLKPWKAFPLLQQQVFEKVYGYISPDKECFSSIQLLEDLGQALCDQPLASEGDLETYQRLAIERPVSKIISHLQKKRDACYAFKLGDGMFFEKHVNTGSDSNEEVQQSLKNRRISHRQQASSSNPIPKNASQIWVYKDIDGTKSLCMIMEYRPSYQMPVLNLRAGLLRADRSSMNVPEDVINSIIMPTDPDEKFVYDSEWLTIAALRQTYAYMIENGLEYSKLSTGEADVFLQVRKNEPHTLYYHLTEPNIEAEVHSNSTISLCHTAVSQTLSFCLMALESKPRSQKWQNETLETAYKAEIDYEAILRRISLEEET